MCFTYGDNTVFFIDPHFTGAADTSTAHAAGDNRRVTCHAAAGCQNARCRMHAVDIFRTGFKPHKNDVAAPGGTFFGFVCCQHNFTRCSPG